MSAVCFVFGSTFMSFGKMPKCMVVLWGRSGPEGQAKFPHPVLTSEVTSVHLYFGGDWNLALLIISGNKSGNDLANRCFLVCSSMLKGPTVRALINTSGPPQTGPVHCLNLWLTWKRRIIYSVSRASVYKSPVMLFCRASVTLATGCLTGSEFKVLSHQVRVSHPVQLSVGSRLMWILMLLSRNICSVFNEYEWKIFSFDIQLASRVSAQMFAARLWILHC